MAERSAENSRSTAFRRAWSEFHESVDGLQEFLESVAPHLSQLEHEDSVPGTSLNPAQRDELRRVLVRVRRGLRAAFEDDAEKSSTAGDDTPAAKTTMEILAGTGTVRARVNLSDDPEVNEAVINSLRRLPVRRRKKMPILLRSVLTMSVAAFEVLVGHLAEARYRLHPNTMGTDKKEFSLEDLGEFEAIDDATTALIERRTDELMRRGLDDWANWLRDEASVKMGELALDWPATQEVFERRHLAVHHAGRVSPQYYRRVGPQAPPVGALLELDEEYIQDALDQIAVLGALLVGCVWAQLLPKEHQDAGGLLDIRAYAFMERGKWAAAQHLCRVSQDRLRLAEDTRHRLRMNELLSIKRQSGLEAIRIAAEAMDTSALSRDFKLAKLALLDRFDEAIAVARAALAAEEVALRDLQTWFVLEELRERPEFRALADLPVPEAREAKPTTPSELAGELGVAPPTLRNWLRKNWQGAKPGRGRRWVLTQEQIASAREHYGRGDNVPN